MHIGVLPKEAYMETFKMYLNRFLELYLDVLFFFFVIAAEIQLDYAILQARGWTFSYVLTMHVVILIGMFYSCGRILSYLDRRHATVESTVEK
jgi:hypothetical protein